ncbi:MAG: hypothetical protein L6R42_006154 [Xanthoria sp. 1 TBL-2021]|nr:MAG: hypothetical protein L6R42_006154 [Xanthoria sp. 1 TBL-2021]
MADLVYRERLRAVGTRLWEIPGSFDDSRKAQRRKKPPRLARSGQKRCGSVSAFYGQKAFDWDANDMDGWLNRLWSNHTASLSANSKGFAGAFGEWAMGNSDWFCRDDGSSSACDFNPCDDRILNDKGNDTRQAYYTIESVNRLHPYFTGLGQSFQVASIGVALSTDTWATTFYRDKDVKSVTVLREILNALTSVIGIGAAFCQDDTFQKSAYLGRILGMIVLEVMKGFTSANNILMHGDSFQDTGDIRTYLKGGLFLDFGGVDKVKLIDTMNTFLIGQAVNQLYRTKKVSAMGGGACGDAEGVIGNGPQDQSVCSDGKAWYLYYWQENDVVSTKAHQWGRTAAPPGSEQLYSYNVACFSYNAATAPSRAQDALTNGWANPGSKGASWEGVFTLPVCDVGWAASSDMERKQHILQGHDHDARPNWCGPVCPGDLQTTREFIKAANMENFMSPKGLCEVDPGY